MEIIIGIAVGLLTGLAVGLFFYLKKGNGNASANEAQKLNEQLVNITSQLNVSNDRLLRNEELISTLKSELQSKEEEKIKLAASISASIATLEASKEQMANLKSEITAFKRELSEQQNLTDSFKTKSIELEKENKYLKEALDKQKKDLEEIGNQFTKEFKLLADQIMEDKSQRFVKINQENIDRLLKPLDENIKQFQKQVQETYEKESRERFSLGEKVKELGELNKTISEEAKNLTEALKGQVKTQGNWGEMILDSILSKSGLVKGREYTVQESFTDSTGKRFQPDVIVSYPDKRKVIIDSKVSLIAYERYSSSKSVEEQQKAATELLHSMRRHIDGLSGKNYPDLVDTLDFVMMFVPIEPAFILAMETDPNIWNYAYEKRVLLISPTNLIAALKLIYDLWQREYRNRNAIEIAKRGGLLYDKFVNFLENFTQIGDSLVKAQNTYQSAFSQLKDGRGSLITQAQQLKELGVNAKKNLPENLFP